MYTSQSIVSIFYFRGEIKDKVSDVVPSFDLLIPKPKEDILEDVSFILHIILSSSVNY